MTEDRIGVRGGVFLRFFEGDPCGGPRMALADWTLRRPVGARCAEGCLLIIVAGLPSSLEESGLLSLMVSKCVLELDLWGIGWGGGCDCVLKMLEVLVSPLGERECWPLGTVTNCP